MLDNFLSDNVLFEVPASGLYEDLACYRIATLGQNIAIIQGFIKFSILGCIGVGCLASVYSTSWGIRFILEIRLTPYYPSAQASRVM